VKPLAFVSEPNDEGGRRPDTFATKIERLEDESFCATFDSGQRVGAKAVVVATGVQYRRLPIDRLEDFEGAGIYYAATETEARYCKGMDAVIIGGGNSAGQAAMFLSRSVPGVAGRFDVELSLEPAGSGSQDRDRILRRRAGLGLCHLAARHLRGE
jgi:hypothetical protein